MQEGPGGSTAGRDAGLLRHVVVGVATAPAVGEQETPRHDT